MARVFHVRLVFRGMRDTEKLARRGAARRANEISGLLGVTEETIAAALAQLFQGTRGYYMRTLRSDG